MKVRARYAQHDAGFIVPILEERRILPAGQIESPMWHGRVAAVIGRVHPGRFFCLKLNFVFPVLCLCSSHFVASVFVPVVCPPVAWRTWSFYAATRCMPQTSARGSVLFMRQPVIYRKPPRVAAFFLCGNSWYTANVRPW